MGMFDYVAGLDLQCPAGHKLDGFQTKDLECELLRYVVKDSKDSAARCLTLPGSTHEWGPDDIYVYTYCELCPDRYGSMLGVGRWCAFTLKLTWGGVICQIIEHCED